MLCVLFNQSGINRTLRCEDISGSVAQDSLIISSVQKRLRPFTPEGSLYPRHFIGDPGGGLCDGLSLQRVAFIHDISLETLFGGVNLEHPESTPRRLVRTCLVTAEP